MNTHTGKQIFKHEVAHIQEKHTHDKLFVNILLIFFWCNPFFWLYRKELNMIHEFIADRKAVADRDTASFAAMILQATYPQHRFGLTNNFFYSPIKRRLLMLTKNNNPRVNYITRVMVLPLVVLVFAAFSFKQKTNNATAATKLNIIPYITDHPGTITLFDSLLKYSDATKLTKDTLPNKNSTITLKSSKQPLFILDGVEADSNILRRLDPNKINSINVLKDRVAFDKYGEKGNNGVIEIILKKNEIAKAEQPKVAIALDKFSVLYIGIDNPVTITLPDIPSDRLLVSTNNSSIRGNNGKYIVRVTAVGEATITVSTIKNNQRVILSTQSFQIKRIPDPTDTDFPDELKGLYKLDSSRISQLKQKYILEQQNLATPKLYFGDVTGSISEVEFFKKQKEMRISGGYTFLSAVVYFTTKGHTDVVVLDGNSLSPIRGYLDRCESGSVITFDNIRVSDPNGQVRGIEGISYSLYSVNEVSGVAPAKLDYAEKQLLAKNADAALEKAVVERKLNDQELQNLKQKLLLEQQNIAKSDYTEKAILYEKELLVQQSNLVFTKAEVSPMFTGGDEAWRKYLQKNLDPRVPLNEGWKAGKYTVIVKFIVRMDGTVSDVGTENYKGSKTSKHCISIIQHAPKWQPAIQNGKRVNAYKKQPITFVIEEQP